MRKRILQYGWKEEDFYNKIWRSPILFEGKRETNKTPFLKKKGSVAPHWFDAIIFQKTNYHKCGASANSLYDGEIDALLEFYCTRDYMSTEPAGHIAFLEGNIVAWCLLSGIGGDCDLPILNAERCKKDLDKYMEGCKNFGNNMYNLIKNSNLPKEFKIRFRGFQIPSYS